MKPLLRSVLVALVNLKMIRFSFVIRPKSRSRSYPQERLGSANSFCNFFLNSKSKLRVCLCVLCVIDCIHSDYTATPLISFLGR